MSSLGVDGIPDAVGLVADLRAQADALTGDIKTIVGDLATKRDDPCLFGGPDEFNDFYVARYDENAPAILGIGQAPTDQPGGPQGVQALGPEGARLAGFLHDSLSMLQYTEHHNQEILSASTKEPEADQHTTASG